MAKNTKGNEILPINTLVEVFAIKDEQIIKSTMTYGQSLDTTKKAGWTYKVYQVGFCSLKPTKIV